MYRSVLTLKLMVMTLTMGLTMMNTLILGMGNLLWADDGFGIKVLKTLQTRYYLPPENHLLDASNPNLLLLPFLQHCRNLLIFDTIDFGLPVGTLKIVRNDNVRQYSDAKTMHLYQIHFQDLLNTAHFSQHYPDDITLIAVQPNVVDEYHDRLSYAVAEQVEPAIGQALAQLSAWGVQATPRLTTLSNDMLEANFLYPYLSIDLPYGVTA